MGKKYYSINIPGKYGYSFAVGGEFTEDEAVDMAVKADLFNDADDADYAIVEELTESEIKHFKDWGCLHEL